VGESAWVANGCQVGEEVGEEVGGKVAVGAGASVVVIFPSARDSERPPKRRPTEARAIMIPRSACHKFFIIGSLLATLARPAGGG
jgi:hypothetical protein